MSTRLPRVPANLEKTYLSIRDILRPVLGGYTPFYPFEGVHCLTPGQTSPRMPVAHILGEYEVLAVPVTGKSSPTVLNV